MLNSKSIQLPGWLQRFVNVVRGANEAGISQAAASLAYYALFSIFPLALVLIALSSSLWEGAAFVDRITPLITRMLPMSEEFIRRNFARLSDLSGTIGAVSLISLIWSSSNVFTVLNYNINRAWEGSHERSFLGKRLTSFAVMLLILLMLGVYVFSTSALQVLLLTDQLPSGGDSFFASVIWDILNMAITWLLVFILLFFLYFWIPNTDVPRKAATIAAGVTTLMLFIIARGFSWYVSSGFANYEVIYGSLSTMIIFLLYVYLSSYALLMGNHLVVNLADGAPKEQ